MQRRAPGAALLTVVLACALLTGCVREAKPDAAPPAVASSWREKATAATTDPSVTATPPPDPQLPPVSPTGTGLPVVQVSYGTDFDPMSRLVPSVPDLTIYADGTAIAAQAPEDPLLPSSIPVLEVTRLGAARVEALLEAAGDAGLLAGGEESGPAEGESSVPGLDWAVLTLTLTVDGTTYVHRASLVEPADGTVVPVTDGPVLDFVEAQVDTLPVSGGAPYAPAAYAGAATFALIDTQLSDEPLDLPTWPLDTGLAELSTCRLLAADEVALVQQALTGTQDWGMWLDDGVPMLVTLRPLLPHEDACPV